MIHFLRVIDLMTHGLSVNTMTKIKDIFSIISTLETLYFGLYKTI